MKILVTGTHFTPALATIEALKKFPQAIEIVYVGRKHTLEGDKTLSVESQVFQQLNIRFVNLIAGRSITKFNWVGLISLVKLPIGFFQAILLVVHEAPDLVLSFGGYVSTPIVFASWLLNIPVIIHEQTMVAGLANQISAMFASKIAVSFKHQAEGKRFFTGNPIRPELLNPTKASGQMKSLVSLSKLKKLPLIFVTGGNQGSHVINQAIFQILPKLNKRAVIIHQTGQSKYNDYEKSQQLALSLEKPDQYLMVKWVEVNDFGFILKNADLVICRAGINTLLEVAHFLVPAIMVPYPNLFRQEQQVNARFFAEKGLGEVLPQSELNGPNLMKIVDKILAEYKRYRISTQNLADLADGEASYRLALECLILSRGESY